MEVDNQKVVIVDGARTPFTKAGTIFKQYSALDLAIHATKGLIDKSNLDSQLINEIVFGNVVLDPRIPHLARELILQGKLPSQIHALTMSNNCITGLSAIRSIHDSIKQGRSRIGIAGGVESMSNPAVLFNRSASRIFLDANTAKSTKQKLATFFKLRPSHFVPTSPGVKEPSTGLSMGEHTELMVKEWKISRQEQDEIAFQSHMNAAAATEDGRLAKEIIPMDDCATDTLIRSDTSLEQLVKLPPVFDRTNFGTITAGNSSPLTDGAAVILLMSYAHAQQSGYQPLAMIKDFEFAGIDPGDGLLMGPALAVPRLLQRNNLTLSDFDIVEIHEAFGGQVACNLKAWKFGWKEPEIGSIKKNKVNPLGSSIAIGHPFAATGIRIATTLANEMKRTDANLGLISICGAGATAAAMILERT